MLKSILLVFAGGALIAVPAAMASGGTQQQTQSPAAPAATQSTPDTSQAPAAAPPAPVMAPNMRNPVKPTADSQAKAKQIYAIDCAMCHGDNGNGKTDLATSMGLTLADFTDPKSLDGKMDGALFNQIRNGTDKMPPEDKGRASDTEVWNLIIYLRNLSKPTASAQAK